MKLTDLEREILQHRLDVPDCIHDAYFDLAEDDEPPEFTEDDLQAAIDSIYAGLPMIPDDPTEVEKAVLWDCMDGSTFMQAVDAEYEERDFSETPMNFGKWRAYHKAADSLEKKIQSLGIDVQLARI